ETLVLLEKKLSQLFVIVCFVKAGDGPVSGGVVVFLPEPPHAASVSAATSRSTSPLTTGKPRPPAASALPARRSARTGGRARRAAFARGCAPTSRPSESRRTSRARAAAAPPRRRGRLPTSTRRSSM